MSIQWLEIITSQIGAIEPLQGTYHGCIPCIDSPRWESIPPLVFSHPEQLRLIFQWRSSTHLVNCLLIWLGVMRVFSQSVSHVWLYVLVWWFAGTHVNAIDLDVTDPGELSLHLPSDRQLIQITNRQHQIRLQPARLGPRQFLHRK